MDIAVQTVLSVRIHQEAWQLYVTYGNCMSRMHFVHFCLYVIAYSLKWFNRSRNMSLCLSFFLRVRKIATSDYYLRHVSVRPSVHPYGTTRLPLNEISSKF